MCQVLCEALDEASLILVEAQCRLGEDKRRNVSLPTLPWAAVSRALPLLLFFQHHATYLSGSLSTAQALGPHPPSGHGCGTHASGRISPNPANCAEELAARGYAGSPGVLLSLDRQWSCSFPGQGCRARMIKASQSGFPFLPSLWASVLHSISALPPPGQNK